MTIAVRHFPWVFPAFFTLGLAIAPATRASESPTQPDVANLRSRESEILNQMIPYIKGNDPLMNQTSSVSQLSDVKPTDWAFQALQSLVERYGCIVGYPDKTYRGNRALTRYEFAAGLNACIDRINELIAASTAELAKKEDLETLQRLQEEFAAELAGVRGRLDALEVRAALLEKQQFSTTTKLQGEVILGLASPFGDERALNSDQWRVIDAAPTPAARNAARAAAFGAAGPDVQDNVIFADRIRLNLTTSFTGRDRLFTRLEANNTLPFTGNVTGTNQTRLGWDASTGFDNNSVQLGKANYTFPLNNNLTVIIDAIGGEFFSNFNTFSPYFENPATGAVSRFARFSPIYRTSNTGSGNNTGAGISANFKLGRAFTLSAGYLARRANDPTDTRGLFDGTQASIVQLAFQPSRDFGIGFTYSHAYYSGVNNDISVSGAYGTTFANQPFGAGFATSSNNFGIQATYRLTPGLALSGWGLYTQAIAENGKGSAAVTRGDKADIWSWAVGLAFPDLGGKGNLAGLIFGQPPKVTRSDFGPPVLALTTPRREDEDTSYHLEAFYRLQVTNNISITPGLFAIFNPEGDSNNDTLLVGVIRTTFRF